RKRPRSFGETTDISEYPHRGTEWCAATAPLAPRRASRPAPDRTRYASECDAVRYATLWTTISPRSPSPRLSPTSPWPWSDPFVWLGMRSATGHSVRGFTVRGLTRTHDFEYGIIIAVPMTMREINDPTDLQI